MNNKENNWGGKRDGAGRKGYCEKTTTICWRVSEEAKEWIVTQSEELGISKGAVIDLLIEAFEEQALKD